MSSVVQRNREIWERFRKGESAQSLAKVYAISLNRVYQLVASEDAREYRSKFPVNALSARSRKALLNNGIVSVHLEEVTPAWVVANLDEGDLRAIRNLGQKGRDEIIAWLAVYGLKLRPRDVVWTRLNRQPIPRRCP